MNETKLYVVVHIEGYRMEKQSYEEDSSFVLFVRRIGNLQRRIRCGVERIK